MSSFNLNASFASVAPGAGDREWEGDKPNCSQCGAKFTMMRRRHHCRKCGRCVCHPCSSNKVMLDGWGTQRRVCTPCISSPFADNLSDTGSNPPHQGPSLASLAYPAQAYPVAPTLPSMPEHDVPVYSVTERIAPPYMGNTTSPYSASSTSPWAAVVEKSVDGSVTLSTEAVSELSRVQERLYDLAGSLEELGYQDGRPRQAAMVQTFPMEPGELTKQAGIDFDDAIARCEASISPLAETLGQLRELKKYEAQAIADANRIAELESRLKKHEKIAGSIATSNDTPVKGAALNDQNDKLRTMQNKTDAQDTDVSPSVKKRGTVGGASDLAKQMSKDREKWMKKPLIKNLLPT